MQSCCCLPLESQGKPQGDQMLKQEHLASCQGSAWLSPYSSLVLWIQLKVDSPRPWDSLLALAPCVEGRAWTVPCLLSNIHYMTLGSASLGVHKCWFTGLKGSSSPSSIVRGEWISARCDEATAAAGFLFSCISQIFPSDSCHSSHFIKIKFAKKCFYC